MSFIFHFNIFKNTIIAFSKLFFLIGPLKPRLFSFILDFVFDAIAGDCGHLSHLQFIIYPSYSNYTILNTISFQKYISRNISQYYLPEYCNLNLGHKWTVCVIPSPFSLKSS